MATNNCINQIGKLPGFDYINQSKQASVTGNGAIYTVQFTHSLFQIGTSYDGTSEFHAPFDGIYRFDVIVPLEDITVAMTRTVFALVCNGISVDLYDGNVVPNLTTGSIIITGGSTVQLLAGHVVSCRIVILGGAGNTASITSGFGGHPPHFSGYMISGL